jgi:hypothetical protein
MRYYNFKSPIENFSKGLLISEIKKKFKKKNVKPFNSKELSYAVSNMNDKEYILLDRNYKFLKNNDSVFNFTKKSRPLNIFEYNKIGKKKAAEQRLYVNKCIKNKLNKTKIDKPYFGWSGFDNKKRIVSYINLVCSSELQSLFSKNNTLQDVKVLEKMKIKSLCSKNKFYDVKLIIPKSKIQANIVSECECYNKFYEGDRYDKYVNPSELFCKHSIVAFHQAYNCIKGKMGKDKSVFNIQDPFFYPSEKTIKFVDKCRDNVVYGSRKLNKSEINLLVCDFINKESFSELFVEECLGNDKLIHIYK